ncbi:glycosyltransferase [Desulfonatronovibrio magnus]|uniref:glycosyltransferase n=1 Tax=Desulfonatronovibrio magnus TaxID=698827 RepID=UPI0005EAD84A|nr:glycosyltransferase [Desulfonatronovibrio magnus]
MKIIIFYPPAGTTTGGMMVLVQLGKTLRQLAVSVEFCAWDRDHVPYLSEMGFKVVTGSEVRFKAGDIFIVPEGWPNALALGLKSKARCFVYCQNWAYLFSALPDNISWNDLNVDFIAVSDPVRQFIHAATGRNCNIIRPYIDQNVFLAPESKKTEKIQVACMPRKNKALIKQIKRFVLSRNPGLSDVQWVYIHGLEHNQVAALLQKSHIFLATGFPEGCPLPPLEAMASGCLVVGFAGFGGWDYMRGQNNHYLPEISLRDVPWKGNGFFSADGDVYSAALNLEKSIIQTRMHEPELKEIINNAQLTAQFYCSENQKKEVKAWLGQMVS